jgi:RNA polymerase sigma-32 factor
VQRLLDRGTVTQPATLPDVAAPADDGDEERVTMAREHIAALPERLRRVMELRYSGDDGMTLLEVGNVVGVSRERVRQLETAALKVLRAKFAADEQSALEVA